MLLQCATNLNNLAIRLEIFLRIVEKLEIDIFVGLVIIMDI